MGFFGRFKLQEGAACWWRLVVQHSRVNGWLPNSIPLVMPGTTVFEISFKKHLEHKHFFLPHQESSVWGLVMLWKMHVWFAVEPQYGSVCHTFKRCYLETWALCRTRVWHSRLGSLCGTRTRICSTELHSFRMPTYRPGCAHWVLCLWKESFSWRAGRSNVEGFKLL